MTSVQVTWVLSAAVLALTATTWGGKLGHRIRDCPCKKMPNATSAFVSSIVSLPQIKRARKGFWPGTLVLSTMSGSPGRIIGIRVQALTFEKASHSSTGPC